MTATVSADLASLPLPPKNPLPYRQRASALRSFHSGMDKLRDAGGPVTRFRLGPGWLMPPIVVATSPQAIRDILSIKDGPTGTRMATLDADFPLAVPFTMVADGPIRARIQSRRRVTAQRELGIPT